MTNIQNIFVPDGKIEDLNKVVARFNKKAVKWGLPELTVDMTPVKKEFSIMVADVFSGEPKPSKIEVSGFDVSIIGQVPVIDGWELCGCISIEDGLVSAKTVVGKNIPLEWIKEAPKVCDHCHQSRYRVKYFVMEKDGEFMKVGSSCVKDYTGNAHAFDMLGFDYPDYTIKDFKDDLEGGFYGAVRPEFELREFLFKAILSVNLYGYRKAFDGPQTTGQHVCQMFFNSEENQAAKRDLTEKYGSEDDAKLVEFSSEVDDVIQYISGLTPNSEYVVVCQNIIKAGYATMKTANFAASMVPVYYKEKTRIAEQANSNEKNEHVGEIGERLMKLPVTVTSVKQIEGYYGLSTLVEMKTEEGCRVKFFYTGKENIDQSYVGQKFLVTGRVKKHDEFKGTKQTVLTRAKLESV